MTRTTWWSWTWCVSIMFCSNQASFAPHTPWCGPCLNVRPIVFWIYCPSQHCHTACTMLSTELPYMWHIRNTLWLPTPYTPMYVIHKFLKAHTFCFPMCCCFSAHNFGGSFQGLFHLGNKKLSSYSGGGLYCLGAVIQGGQDLEVMLAGGLSSTSPFFHLSCGCNPD